MRKDQDLALAVKENPGGDDPQQQFRQQHQINKILLIEDIKPTE